MPVRRSGPGAYAVRCNGPKTGSLEHAISKEARARSLLCLIQGAALSQTVYRLVVDVEDALQLIGAHAFLGRKTRADIGAFLAEHRLTVVRFPAEAGNMRLLERVGGQLCRSGWRRSSGGRGAGRCRGRGWRGTG